jgi:hypothetical protein
MVRNVKLGVCLLFCGFLSACQEPERLKGYHPGIVPMDSMELLLTEVHLIESYRNKSFQQVGRDTVSSSAVKSYYVQALGRHGVSLDRFLESYAFYQKQHPVILDSLYEGVNQRLNEMLTDTYQ